MILHPPRFGPWKQKRRACGYGLRAIRLAICLCWTTQYSVISSQLKFLITGLPVCSRSQSFDSGHRYRNSPRGSGCRYGGSLRSPTFYDLHRERSDLRAAASLGPKFGQRVAESRGLKVVNPCRGIRHPLSSSTSFPSSGRPVVDE